MTLQINTLKKYPNPIFVETGSSMGDGIAMAIRCGFNKIFSTEINPDKYKHCQERFSSEINSGTVNLILGDSVNTFPLILEKINQPTTFWLDAHWDDGPKGELLCPLVNEINLIHAHPISCHTLLIDDRRCFSTGSTWGKTITESEVMSAISQSEVKYNIAYEDGIIPKDIIAVTYE